MPEADKPRSGEECGRPLYAVLCGGGGDASAGLRCCDRLWAEAFRPGKKQQRPRDSGQLSVPVRIKNEHDEGRRLRRGRQRICRVL